MAVSKTKVMDPWKAKRWFPIYAPKYMKSAFIGETPAVDREKVAGREVTISLAAVIGDIKKQNVQIKFKITGFDGNNALTDVKRMEVAPAYIKRQIRKGRDRIDDSFILATSDKKNVALKPLLITKNKINSSKKTLLRKLAKQELRDYVSKVPYSELVQDLISSKLQKTIGNSLRRIYPLRSSEIRVMEIIEPAAGESAGQPSETVEEKIETPVEEKIEEKKPEEKARDSEEKKEEPVQTEEKKTTEKKPKKKAKEPEQAS